MGQLHLLGTQTQLDKVKNSWIARVRCRVEHVFGYMVRFMAGLFVGFMVWVCGV